MVLASPRGFASSTRLSDSTPYRASDMVGDLIYVLRHAGYERAPVLGYSFVGALAAWMAHEEPAVTAAVVGGFPLLGDYAITFRDVERQHQALDSDPVARGRIIPRFDTRAAYEFYRDLADLPVDGLVDGARCPLYAFWGSSDEEVGLVMSSGEHARGLQARGVTHRVIPGLDHEALNASVELALDDAVAWLKER